MRKKIASVVALCLLPWLATAQQSVPPAQTPYYNFLQGLQLNGSWGSTGNCIISTGSGATWGPCGSGGGAPGGTSGQIQFNSSGLFGGTLATADASGNIQTPGTMSAAAAPQSYGLLTSLGNSIAYGSVDKSVAGGWTSRLANAIGYLANNNGVGGQLAPQIQARFLTSGQPITMTGNQIPAGPSCSVTLTWDNAGQEAAFNATSAAPSVAQAPGDYSNFNGTTTGGLWGTIAGVDGQIQDGSWDAPTQKWIINHIYTFYPLHCPGSPVSVPAHSLWTPKLFTWLNSLYGVGEVCINGMTGSTGATDCENAYDAILAQIPDQVAGDDNSKRAFLFQPMYAAEWQTGSTAANRVLAATNYLIANHAAYWPVLTSAQMSNPSAATAAACVSGCNLLQYLSSMYDPGNAVDVFEQTFNPLVVPSSMRYLWSGIGTLTSNITDTVSCGFTLSSATFYEYVQLNSGEKIQVNAMSGNTVTSCTRGFAGTTATTHSSGESYSGQDDRHPSDKGHAAIAAFFADWIKLKSASLMGQLYNSYTIGQTLANPSTSIYVQPGFKNIFTVNQTIAPTTPPDGNPATTANSPFLLFSGQAIDGSGNLTTAQYGIFNQAISPTSFRMAFGGQNFPAWMTDQITFTGNNGSTYKLANRTASKAAVSLSNYSITSNAVTWTTGTQSYTQGMEIVPINQVAGSYLNGIPFTITSATSTTVTATSALFTHADVGSTADSGTLTANQSANGWTFGGSSYTAGSSFPENWVPYFTNDGTTSRIDFHDTTLSNPNGPFRFAIQEKDLYSTYQHASIQWICSGAPIGNSGCTAFGPGPDATDFEIAMYIAYRNASPSQWNITVLYSDSAGNLKYGPCSPIAVASPNQAPNLGTPTGCTASTIGASGIAPSVTPAWLLYLGTGADGSNTSASGALTGVKYYTNFTVPFGNTVTVTGSGLTVYATGACTIAGTISAVGGWTSSNSPMAGGPSGGSGGGTAAGTAGQNSFATAASFGNAAAIGGTAGASSGGAGGNAATIGSANRMFLSIGGGTGGQYFAGGKGSQGGSTGGAGGGGGAGVTLICQSITGTDGTHTGIIDASGLPGVPPTANSTGAGSGGGGGVVNLSSQAAVTTWPTVYTAPGGSAGCTVPLVVGQGGTCTTEPMATLGVSGGAFSGAATVVTAGAGCGTGTGMTWTFEGGGGTPGTATFNPTFSGGALASGTVTPGTSSGYTASTFTTCGAAGQSATGWYSEWANGVQVH